jgi:HEAT repeat protein
MRTGIRRFGIVAGMVLGAAGALRAEDADAKQAHDEAVKTALDAFRKAYKGGEEDRAAAVQGLAEPKDRKVIAMLAKTLSDPAPTVRIESAAILGGYEKSREAGAALVRGLLAARKQPEVQIACLNALGSVRDWNAAPVIVKHFKDPDSRVGTAAIQAAGRIKNPVFVKELIKFLDDAGGGGAARAASIEEWRVRRARIRAAAHQALCDITGEQKPMPADPAMALMGGRRGGKEWEDWWKVYGARVTAKLQQAEREEQARIALEKRPYK